MSHTDIVKGFAASYIAYCRGNGINMAKICRELTAKQITMPKQKLYDWRRGDVRLVSVYTLCELANAVGKPLKFFIPD